MISNEVIKKYTSMFLWISGGLLVLSILLAFVLENFYVLLLPVLILGAFFLIFDYSLVFYLLILSIPASIHLTLGSVAVDVASEPLMLVLLFIFPMVFLLRFKEFEFLKHPVIMLLAGQLIWAIYTSFFSADHERSIKYLLAKLWYIVPLVILGGIIIKDHRNIKYIIWLFFSSLLLICIYVCIVHSGSRFSFETANLVMNPFYPNHVIYSTTIAVFLPFVWFARFWYAKGSFPRMILNMGLLVFLFSVMVAYTRASWLAMLALIPCFLVIKYKFTKAGIIAAGVALLITIVYLVHKNQYLEYAIEYKKVIFHEGDLEKHLEATYQFEDVSGMERVYRWAAAKKMIEDNWFLGTGPNTFYPEYKRYTVNAFTTFVSDNPERSTTHNYFLMVMTEQGAIGFLLFTALYIYLLLRGTTLYSSLRNRESKNLAMATTLSLMMLVLHLFLNDLIETDKLGSLFYLSCLFILKLDLWNKEEKVQESLQEK